MISTNPNNCGYSSKSLPHSDFSSFALQNALNGEFKALPHFLLAAIAESIRLPQMNVMPPTPARHFNVVNMSRRSQNTAYNATIAINRFYKRVKGVWFLPPRPMWKPRVKSETGILPKLNAPIRSQPMNITSAGTRQRRVNVSLMNWKMRSDSAYFVLHTRVALT